jgi:polysaccharide biosynthesis transport protein
MDVTDRSNIDVAGANAPPQSPPHDQDPFFSRDRSTAKSNGGQPRGILHRLAGRWWQFLLLWLMISAPIAFLIYVVIQPTYEAVSLLRIEPAVQDLLSPLNRGPVERQDSTYLKTQVGLIMSARVLNPAIADPLVVNLATIKKSADPRTDLLEKLTVVIVEDTNLIRIALESPNPEEAVTIVQAVVQSYLTQNTDYSRGANRDLTESLRQQLLKIATEIDLKRSMLKELSKRGNAAVVKPEDRLNPKTQTDPTRPTFKVLAEEQVAKLMDRLVQDDVEYLDAVSNLEATRMVRERHLKQINEELENRVAEEFSKDPKVVALINQIDECKKLGGSEETALSPAVIAAREKEKRLSEEYKSLWEGRRLELRKRLTQRDAGMLSEARIRELEVAVEAARRKKDALAQQFEKIQVEQKAVHDETFEGAFLSHQVQSLQGWEETVKRNLEQLKFEASQDKYRVVLVDSAAASKTPTNNKRLKYMAAAPVAVLFLLLGLFLAQEIKAGRRAATG